MSENSNEQSESIKKVEIFSSKTSKTRVIFPLKKEIIIYNDELNEFQLLPAVSASYDEDS